MKVYSAAVLAGAPVAGAPLVGLWAPTRRTILREIQVVQASTAIDIALKRISTRGTATAVSGEAEDGSNETPTSQLDNAYTGSNPAETGNVHAAYSMSTTLGVRILVWEFWDSLEWIEIGAGIIVKNLAGVTGPQQECSVIWEE